MPRVGLFARVLVGSAVAIPRTAGDLRRDRLRAFQYLPGRKSDAGTSPPYEYPYCSQ
jgi:hypothetical protein